MQKLKVKTYLRTCVACPSQWEGTLEDGRMFYARFRWGGLSVRLSEYPTKDVMEAVRGEPIDYGNSYSKDKDPFDGMMSTEEFVKRTQGCFDWSEAIETNPLEEEI